MSPRKHYTYEVVTHNGCGIHGMRFTKCSDARQAMERIAASWSIPGDTYEIKRVEHVAPGRYRYQMRQRSRWVERDIHRNHTVRKPDWSVTATGRRVA